MGRPPRENVATSLSVLILPVADLITSGLTTTHQRTGRISSMRRVLAILGSATFLVIAPGIVAGYVPWRICRWQFGAPLLGISALRLPGVLLIAAGLPVLLDSFARFVLQGLGTPAPIFPTRHLVVSGLFRFVRNPMYVAVVSLILGQGLLFGSARVVAYSLAVWVGFYLFILIYEEPILRRSYGAEYEEYCANVPRWIPRLRPWNRNRG
jgi:protein-S-isoprenylcysteine O-methyltransferase Ste14